MVIICIAFGLWLRTIFFVFICLFNYKLFICYVEEMNDTQKTSTLNASPGTAPPVGSHSSDTAAVTVNDTKQAQDASQHSSDKLKYR